MFLACAFVYTVLCTAGCTQSTLPLFGTHEKISLRIPEQYRSQSTTQNEENSAPRRSVHSAYLFYIDEKGDARNILLHEGQGEIQLVLPKNRVTPFLFYMDETDIRPQGCIYPFGTKADKSGGFTAFILYRLFVLSHNSNQTVYEHVSLFNWPKLNALICTYDDPWQLDDVLIAEKIAKGTFNGSHIRTKPPGI